VNGKALMSGIRLESLDASDMVDVLHFMFEEDLYAATGEEAIHKSKIRTTLYREFYKKEYDYTVDDSSNNSYSADGSLLPPLDDEFGLEPFNPDNPVKPKTKAFVPTTKFSPNSALPFGRDVDAPLG
jgi:hypothetical protein